MYCCVLDYNSTRKVKEEDPGISFDLGGEVVERKLFIREEVLDKFKRSDRSNGF